MISLVGFDCIYRQTYYWPCMQVSKIYYVMADKDKKKLKYSYMHKTYAQRIDEIISLNPHLAW